MRPKTTAYPLGFVIEFKVIFGDGDVDKSVAAALRQIEDNAYDVQLRDAGVAAKNIRRLAIVVSGKRVVVRDSAA